MAILLPTNFSVQTPGHIDTRLVVPLLADRDNIAEAIRYWGMIVHVIDSTGANVANTYILNKFHDDDVITNNANWAVLSTLGAGNFWKTQGTTSLGELSTAAVDIQADLSTDLNVSLLRFQHPAATTSAASRTDVYLGPGNGNSSADPWGTVLIGQNNAPLLLPTGEWAGGRNILIGNDILPTFTGTGTHNNLIGRAIGTGITGGGEFSYMVAMGYEALKGMSLPVDDTVNESFIMGIYAMENFSSLATSYGGDGWNVILGSSAAKGASSLWEPTNPTDKGGMSSGVIIGTSAGRDSSIESYNTIIGSSAARNAQVGRGNTIIGTLAGENMPTAHAGNTSTLGDNIHNVIIGNHTGQNSHGNKAVYIGTESGSVAVDGDETTAVGVWTLPRLTGNYNSALGSRAGYSTSTFIGSHNTFIGGQVSYDVSNLTFSNSVVIGSNFNQVMADNKIYLGSTTQDVIFNGPDFSNASQTFHYDGSKEMLIAGASSGLTPDFTLAHPQSGSWSAIYGEEHTFLGGRSVNLFVSGWANTIGNDAVGGIYAGASSFTAGDWNINDGQYGVTIGFGAQSAGYGSVVIGHGYDFGSSGKIGDSANDRTLYAGGTNAINVGAVDGTFTQGNGANANNSGIFAGLNGHIPTDALRSVIIGGSGITADAGITDMVYVPNLRIKGTLTQDDTETQIAAIDSTTNQIVWRDVSTIGTGGNFWASDGTTTLSVNTITVNGTGASSNISINSGTDSSARSRLTLSHTLAQLRANGSAAQYSNVVIATTYAQLFSRDSSGNVKGVEANDASLGIEVIDTGDTTGLFYQASYSTNGISNHPDRWIPDYKAVKDYADSVGGGGTILGSVLATVGSIAYGTGVANTVTSNGSFTYSGNKLLVRNAIELDNASSGGNVTMSLSSTGTLATFSGSMTGMTSFLGVTNIESNYITLSTYVGINESATPATPTVGNRLFSDSGDAGKLKFVDDSGTVYDLTDGGFAEPGIFSGGGTPTLASGVTGAEIRTLIGAGTGSGTVTSSSGANNQVAVFTSSTNIDSSSSLFFDGTNLGVGTNTPSGKLDVHNGNIIISRPNQAITSGTLLGKLEWWPDDDSSGEGKESKAKLEYAATGTWDSNAAPAQLRFWVATTADNTGGTGDNLVIDYSGDVFIGGLASATSHFWFHKSSGDFHADGNIIANSTSLTPSDRRLKENINYIDTAEALAAVDQLKPATYNKIGSDKKLSGHIAQEVEKVLPDLIYESELLGHTEGDLYKTINTDGIIPYLVGAIKELKKEIEELKNK